MSLTVLKFFQAFYRPTISVYSVLWIILMCGIHLSIVFYFYSLSIYCLTIFHQSMNVCSVLLFSLFLNFLSFLFIVFLAYYMTIYRWTSIHFILWISLRCEIFSVFLALWVYINLKKVVKCAEYNLLCFLFSCFISIGIIVLQSAVIHCQTQSLCFQTFFAWPCPLGPLAIIFAQLSLHGSLV